jgi:hypothetical protein
VIGSVAIVVGFVALAVAIFVAAVRLGILVGLRLDRALEARAASSGEEETAAADPGALAPQNSSDIGRRGREEHRGE